MGVIYGGRQMVIPDMGLRVRALRSAAAPPWWQVAGKTCVAAYQPKGAASYAASKVNLANPGTYDAAEGVAPEWASATGWTFNGSSQYLTTGAVVGAGWSILARFVWTAEDARRLLGANDAGFAGLVGLVPVSDSGGETLRECNMGGQHNSFLQRLTSGVYGFAGSTEYINGAVGSALAAPTAYTANGLFLGALNNNDVAGFVWNGSIQAVAIYSATLTAPQVATVSAAMAAL